MSSRGWLVVFFQRFRQYLSSFMWRLGALLGLLVIGLVQCEGDGEDPKSTPELDEFWARLIDQSCKGQVTCGWYASWADCNEALADGLFKALLAPLRASVANGETVFHADKGQACLDAFASLPSCRASVKGTEAYRAYDEACKAVFQGVLSVGAECSDDVECQSQNCEESACNEACCSGTCAPGAAAQLGQPCEPGDCAWGTYCSEGTCLALVPEGGACDYSDMCQPSTFCPIDPNADAPTACTRIPDRGEECSPSMGFCDRTEDFCSSQTGRCEPRRQLGEPCNDEFLTVLGFKISECVGYASCVEGICTARVGPGAQCDEPPDVYDQCVLGLQCVDGSCQNGPIPDFCGG
jgi:hypothetical protein